MLSGAFLSFVLTNSDIITFHCYYTPAELETFINMLSRFKRPMICQEYLARNFGSAFETCLPVMKREKVGALNWGLAEGKCEYRFPWGHKASEGEPAVWFHSIFWHDYTPYSEVEVDILKKITSLISVFWEILISLTSTGKRTSSLKAFMTAMPLSTVKMAATDISPTA